MDPPDRVEVAQGSHVFRELVRIRELKVGVNDRNNVAVLGLERCNDVGPEPDLFRLDHGRELIVKVWIQVAEVIQSARSQDQDKMSASLNVGEIGRDGTAFGVAHSVRGVR